MREILGNISGYDVLYAAILAFVITSVILRLKEIKGIFKNHDELTIDRKGVDTKAVMSRCVKMFPIETVMFKGEIFKKGMNVRVITMQEKIIEGELIGKNDLNVLCILTSSHIIAHEIEKIHEIKPLV